MTTLGAERFFERLSGCKYVIVALMKCLGSIDQIRGLTYRRWPLAASFAILVIKSLSAIWTRSSIFLHPFSKNFKKKCTLKSHFANATHEANFSKAIGIIAFFDFVHASFQLNAFLFVGLFY